MIVARLRAAGCVFAEDEARLLTEAATSPAELEDMVARRVEGLPFEQILGWAEFCGLRIVVPPGVFVPRRRTELLVQQAIAVLKPGAVVVDLCCGSGAVGAAVAAAVADSDVYAADLDPNAVECARRNLARVGGSRVLCGDRVFCGDLYAALPPELRGRVNVIAANAPYVPTGEIAFMPPEARLYEPAVALDGGPDGVALHRRIAAKAPHWLAPGGHLLIETSERQAPATVEAMTAEGLLGVHISHDDDLSATVAIGSYVT